MTKTDSADRAFQNNEDQWIKLPGALALSLGLNPSRVTLGRIDFSAPVSLSEQRAPSHPP